MSISIGVLLFLALWLCVLTGFTFWIYKFFRVLSTNTGEKDLISILHSIAEREKETSGKIDKFKKDLEHFQEESEVYMQKFGFVRFNPFGDMGGDHSFSVALLDGRLTGFVLTGLHTRERTRVYVKHIKRGKSEASLSKEEEKALENALKK